MAAVTDTIGTAGRDFSTMTLWEASLSAHSGDDCTGECYNDSVFDEATELDDANPTSIALTAAVGERHDGTAGSGVRCQCTAGAGGVISLRTNIAATSVTIECIEIFGNTNSLASAISTGGYGSPKIIQEMILHNIETTGNYGDRGVLHFDNSTVTVSNSVIYDYRKTGTGGAQYGIRHYAYISRAYNVSIYAASAAKTTGVSEVTNHNDRNVVSTGNAVADFNVGASSNYNLSSDATAPGANSLLNKSAANQFISTVVGSENLHLKEGADAIGAGTDLGASYATDIDGDDRTGLTWDMGADQSPAVTDTIGTAARDFSTMTLWEASLSAHAGHDCTGECYNDSVFDEAVSHDDTTPTSIILTAATGEEHDGTAGTGVRQTKSSGALHSLNGSSSPTLEKLELFGSVSLGGWALNTSGYGTPTRTIRHLLVHDHQATGGYSHRPCVFGSTGPAIFSNLIVYDYWTTGFQSSQTGVISSGMTVHNVTCYGASVAGTRGIVATSAASRNLLSVSNASYDYLSSGDYCLSSDATAPGANSLLNKSAADQFISTVVGSENLHLKAGADAIGAGTDLGASYATDIDGDDRTGLAWDMGADQLVATGPGRWPWQNRRSRRMAGAR